MVKKVLQISEPVPKPGLRIGNVMKVISISIPDDLLKKIDSMAETQSQGRVKINRSQLISKLLEEILSDQTKEKPTEEAA